MRSTFFVLVLLVHGTAAAAEMSLLARYEFHGHDSPGGVDLQPPALGPLPLLTSVPHLFVAGGIESYVSLSIPATLENEGKTFSVDPVKVATFNADPTGARIYGFGARIGVIEPLSNFEPPPYYFGTEEAVGNYLWPEVTAQAFVPKRGPNFFGYDIDDLTVTVGYVMVIQVYGHAVPEPAFLIMLISGTAILPLMRMKRR